MNYMYMYLRPLATREYIQILFYMLELFNQACPSRRSELVVVGVINQ